MKRNNSDPDLETLQVKKCKLLDSVMNNSANNLAPPPGPSPQGPGLSAVGEADIELRRVVDNFVNIYEQLGKCNGPNVKPNYSYTELAYIAMLRSPNFCLPITEIYRYIQSRFAFFKNSTRKHWKNAVRHSLAKTLCFTKITVGRGKSSSENLSRSTYLWCIIPNSITSFARGDYRPSADRDSGSNSLRWGYYRSNAGQFWDQVGNYLATKMTAFKRDLDTSSDPGQIFESQVVQISESFPRLQDGQPLSSLPVVNTIPAAERQASNDVLRSRAYGIAPPPYNQSVERNHELFTQTFKREAFSQQYVKREAYREITSTPEPSRLYALKSPKIEILSPDSSYQKLSVNRQTPATPAQTVYDFHDSGNESIGLESSLQESRVLSSCRQQQRLGASPPLNLALGSHTPDLSDIDITPFEIPELSDFSHIVSPHTDLLSPHSALQSPHTDLSSPRQDLSFNDSGYVKDYSYSCRLDSPRSFTGSPCRFTNSSAPFMCSSFSAPITGQTSRKFMAEQNHQFATRTADTGNLENHFINHSDPMFGQCNGGYSAWKL